MRFLVARNGVGGKGEFDGMFENGELAMIETASRAEDLPHAFKLIALAFNVIVQGVD